MIDEEKIKEGVRRFYGEIAAKLKEKSALISCCEPAPSCCAPDGDLSCCAEQLYSPEELAGLPESVTGIALGCGNPTAIADLRPGEVVLDLGSGGGIDCFLAARKVGPTGKVIGLDMSPEMIKLARRNAKEMGMTNVDFRYGEMEEIPLPDESVDVVISNCVINLSPNKDAVFAEAYRVLRPSGRLVISDIVTNGELPELIRKSEKTWYSCVSGALDEAVYLDKIKAAGFTDVEVTSRTYFNLDPLDAGEFFTGLAEPRSLAELRASLNNKIVSIKVRARKPCDRTKTITAPVAAQQRGAAKAGQI